MNMNVFSGGKIRMAGDGNQVIRDIVDEYGDLVYNLCQRILNDHMQSEEAAQDVFLKVFQNLDGFRAESSLKTWIYQITYRTAIDYTRRKKHKEIIGEDLPEFSRDSLEETNGNDKEEELAALQIAVRRLPPDLAILIQLYYLEEKNIREISKITGLTESNIKIRLFRARKQLAELMERQKSMKP